MPLQEYHSKRDFSKTSEPKEGGGSADLFVVQEHHARSLHYDLRLPMDGVLKSWAVPKGVPVELKVKRLAVQTEDHPLAYGSYEGEIPKGEYGGGKVIIFDKGPFRLIERNEGTIVFELQGKKINGTYALIRFKGKEQNANNWLIMRTQ